MFVISPVYARVLVREIQRRGIEPSRLLEGTALDEAALDRGSDILAADFSRLLLNARSLTGEPTLGMTIGRNVNILALGPLGSAMANAPTLREGLRVVESFTRIHTSYALVSLRSTLSGLAVTLDFVETHGEAERFHIETGTLLLQDYVEMISGEPLTNASFSFRYPQPAYAAEYSRAYHSPFDFDATENRVVLPREGLDAPSPFYHPELWLQAQNVLGQRLKEMKRSGTGSYTQHVQALLRSSEPPLPDLGAVSDAMHLSERTLNRRLQAEHTSFRDIRKLELHSWSKRYLAQTTLSVEAIGATLGYQDAANFRRAFKAVEQCSPATYRRRVDAHS